MQLFIMLSDEDEEKMSEAEIRDYLTNLGERICADEENPILHRYPHSLDFIVDSLG